MFEDLKSESLLTFTNGCCHNELSALYASIILNSNLRGFGVLGFWGFGGYISILIFLIFNIF